MAYSTTYADLKTDLINLTDEASDEFAAVIDTIIELGETQCLRDLNLQQFRSEVSVGNTVVGTRTIARPATLLIADSLWITVSGEKKPLLPRKYDYSITYAPTVATQGEPKYYAEVDEANYYLVPTPSTICAIVAYGLVRPAGLSGSNTTTWLSRHAGDLLLYACLVQTEKYLTNPGQWKDAWQAEYNDRLAKAKIELQGVAL